MVDENVQRLENDLLVIRQAIRLDRPYAADDVLLLLLTALGGLVAIPLVEFTPIDNRVCFLLALAPMLILTARKTVQRRRNRAARPGLWREIKLSLIVTAIVIPPALGWALWSQQAGTPWLNARASIVFFIGVALAVIGILDESRRGYLAGSLGMIPFGLAIPWLTPHLVAIGGAIVLIVTGLGGAAFTTWRIKCDGDTRAASEAVG